ncbi:hypothetical protein V3Q77_02550 [Flavobacterium davisii]|uniref:Uncharacterized protein n=1 Tax=Flavobacterium davisii TaxID=2906077 RepID=A0A246GF38_9FLAO|nr:MULTISPECIES: hypothetical protein [Flavobacterium]OWP82736.1 hypothetical protein BWK59_14295 [Flavobacterium davisii]
MKKKLLFTVSVLFLATSTIDPIKIKPPRGGRTSFIEKDRSGARPLAYIDKNGVNLSLEKIKAT